MTADPIFELHGSVLVVRGELDPESEAAFVATLEELTATNDPVITVDLTQVHYISSLYARHLAQVAVEARSHGRRLVVKASREVHRLMRLGGLDRICELEVAGAARS